MTMFKLPVWVENCGDGSVAIRVAQSIAEANSCQDHQLEPLGDTEATEIALKIEDGRIYFRTRQIGEVWLPVPECP